MYGTTTALCRQVQKQPACTLPFTTRAGCSRSLTVIYAVPGSAWQSHSPPFLLHMASRPSRLCRLATAPSWTSTDMAATLSEVVPLRRTCCSHLASPPLLLRLLMFCSKACAGGQADGLAHRQEEVLSD